MKYEDAVKIPVSVVREKLNHSPNHLPDCPDAVAYVQDYLKSCGESHTGFDALRWLERTFNPRAWEKPLPGKAATTEWKILRTEELEDLALIRYLESQGVDAELSKQFLQEAYLKNRKTREVMNVIAFANEDVGYAIFGPYIDTLIGKKAISMVNHSEGIRKNIHIFANFIDMLATYSAFPTLFDRYDAICLNSPDLLPSSVSFIAGFGYRKIESWFPNNRQGKQLGRQLGKYVKTVERLKHSANNGIYKSHETVTAWRKAQVTKK